VQLETSVEIIIIIIIIIINMCPARCLLSTYGVRRAVYWLRFLCSEGLCVSGVEPLCSATGELRHFLMRTDHHALEQ